jgi:hypothetical protein
MPRKPQQFDRLRREGIDRIASLANQFIGLVTGVIALIFVGISFKDIPLDKAVSDANPQYVQDVILSVYILCWALGTKMDTSTQKSVYLIDPMGGEIRLSSFFAVGSLAAISLGLLLVRRNELYFSIAMAVFTSIDVLAWLYLRHWFLPSIIKATQEKYEHDKDYFGVIKLKSVEAQVTGSWKWYRQVVLSVVVMCMISSALVPQVKQGIAVAVQKTLHLLSFSVPVEQLSLLEPDLLLFFFVLISEVWHWLYRLRTYWTIRVISELETKYPNAKLQG